MPIIPRTINFSLKIRTPIKTVASKLKTDQIAPTIGDSPVLTKFLNKPLFAAGLFFLLKMV